MNKTSKIATLILMLIGCCGNAFASDYRTATPDIPKNWDPRYNTLGYYTRFSYQVFCSLLTIDENLNVSNALANRWSVSDGGMKYIFEIRSDAGFQNGQSILAEDVVLSLKRMISDSTLSKELKVIKSIHVAKDKTEYPSRWNVDRKRVVIIELFRPYVQLLYIISSPAMAIFPAKQLMENPNVFFKKPISCGPFNIELINKKTVILKKNKYYYNASQVKIERIYFYKYNLNEAVSEFNKGSLDDIILYAADKNEIKREYNVLNGRTYITRMLQFNTKKGVFKSLNMRKAFIYAFDKNNYVKLVNSKNLIPATGFIPKGMIGYSESEYYLYSPEKSRKLLQKEKVDHNKKIIIISSRPQEAEALSVIAKDIEKILGIAIEVKKVTSAEFYQRWISFNDDIMLGGADSIYLDPYFQLRYAIPSYNERCITEFKNKNVEELLERTQTIVNKSERAKLYNKIDNLIMDDALILPLYYGSISTGIYSPDVYGIKLPPNGVQHVRYEIVSK
ncbi:MAG: ABC transporter substrate-binding protein [Pseudomonadota bacterium]